MALTICRKCGGQVSDKAQYCVHCGEPIQPSKTTCPSCKAEVQGTAKYCSNCGYNLNQTEESPKSNNERFPADISSYKRQSTSKITKKASKKKQGPPAWAIAVLAMLSALVIGFLCYTIIVGPIRKESIQQDTNIPKTPPTAITTPQTTANTIETVQSNKPNKPNTSDPASTSQFYEISETEIAYNEACHVSDYEKQSNGSLKYKNNLFHDNFYLIISKEDYTYYMLNHFWVDDCALYNAMTSTAVSIVKNWKDEKSYELNFVKATIGTKPNESRTARLERLSQFTEQWPTDIDEKELIELLIAYGVIINLERTGNDMEFDIIDFKKTANNIGITERFLGYIIAYLGGNDSKYNRIATFNENSVHIKMYEPEPIDIPPHVNTMTFK